MKDFKYILKRVLIGVLIGLIMLLIKSNVFAYVGLGGTNLENVTYKIQSQGNAQFWFQSLTGTTGSNIPVGRVLNYRLILCTDVSSTIGSYYSNDTTDKTTLTFYYSNQSCQFKGTSSIGRVMYVYGNTTYQCPSASDGCRVNGNFTIYIPSQSSWSLLSQTYTEEEISITYDDGTVSVMNDLKNQNNTIINQNTQINNNLNEVNDNLTNDTPPNDNELTSALDAGSLPGGGPISNIITFPLTMFNRFLSVLGTSCTDLTIPIPYVSQSATIQCINVYFTQLGFGAFYEVIGGLIGGVILFYYLMYLYDRVNHLLFLEEKGDLKKYYS